MFLLGLDLYSFTDLLLPGAMAELGHAFDADARLRPERMDVRDPIRNKVTSAEEYLTGAVDFVGSEDILFERRHEPRLAGALSAPSYRLAALRDSPHRLYAGSGDTDEAWLRDPEHLEGFAQLFVRLAGAFDGFYGFASDDQMWRQQAGEFARARRQGRYAPQTPGPLSDGHSVRDVYWLNYFGPAYLELWAERLSGLGVRQERTSNGGVVIWAAETPFLYREDVGSFMDYPWKRPFYDALGLDAFVNAQATSWDKRVPTRADHLRHVRGFDGSAAVTFAAADEPEEPDETLIEGRGWLFPDA